jgi:lactoylglutathione lyase
LKPDDTTRIGFFVEHLDNLFINLKQNNVKIISLPTQTAYGFTAIIEDLDGRKIELTQNSVR